MNDPLMAISIASGISAVLTILWMLFFEDDSNE